MRVAVTVSALGLSLVALSGAHEALHARQGARRPERPRQRQCQGAVRSPQA